VPVGLDEPAVRRALGERKSLHVPHNARLKIRTSA
jgi:hypothetical protein